MRFATALLIAIGLGSIGPTNVNADDRTAQISRVVDGLNSASPAVRLATLEEVSNSPDANLRNLAFSTAFSSSDLVLRSAALGAVMRQTRSFVVEMTKAPNSPDGGVVHYTGGQFEVFISNFNEANGSFSVYSTYSQWNFNNGQRVYSAGPGTLANDRISFDVNMYNAGGSSNCNAVARLQKSSPTLTGTISCDNNSGTFPITIEILR